MEIGGEERWCSEQGNDDARVISFFVPCESVETFSWIWI